MLAPAKQRRSSRRTGQECDTRRQLKQFGVDLRRSDRLADNLRQTRYDMRGTSLENRSSGGRVGRGVASPTRALVLATISFALSFAAWGLVGGLASVFSGLYQLTASQTAL